MLPIPQGYSSIYAIMCSDDIICETIGTFIIGRSIYFYVWVTISKSMYDSDTLVGRGHGINYVKCQEENMQEFL